MEEKIELLAINKLLNYKFLVPSYQRGYRWKEQQVKDLLKDIYEFQINPDIPSDQYYCLQPIVVNKQNEEFILIDGQQRLTTIFIIFSYLKDIMQILGKEKFELNYKTRPDSESFMQNIDLSLRNDNVDYFHISEAYETIKDWFEEQDGTIRIDFVNTLLREDGKGKNVRVIWYEIGEDANPIDIFTRLNMGKIPLTNAELIKALFLSKHSKFPNAEVKKLRQFEIANQWDSMELALQEDMFWYFLNDANTNYTNRIELLFDLLTPESSKDIYHTFRYFNSQIVDEKSNVEKLWASARKLFLTLNEWYHNHTYYHLTGFLLVNNVSLKHLISKSEELDKDDFLAYLKNEIKNKVVIDNLREYTYDDDKKKVKSALLLFNIVSMLNINNKSLRFSFHKYKKESWDIEHIHSIKSDPPSKDAHKNDWLKEVKIFVEDKSSIEQVDKDIILEKINDYLENPSTRIDSSFIDLYEFIVDKFSEKDDAEAPNDISNLTLLDSGTNRGYKNAIYPIKRNKIIDKDKNGTFIPVCTKNVFLKYYSDNVEQMTFWGKNERENYKNNFITTIKKYFTEEQETTA